MNELDRRLCAELSDSQAREAALREKLAEQQARLAECVQLLLDVENEDFDQSAFIEKCRRWLAVEDNTTALDKLLEKSKAIDDVVAERQRQIGAEGWTEKHDDQHAAGELAMASACYALPNPPMKRHFIGMEDRGGATWVQPEFWPWDPKWWKPKDRRSNLVRAAALLIAEIERIDRSASKAPNNESCVFTSEQELHAAMLAAAPQPKEPNQ